MTFNEVPHPLQLAIRMLYYAIWESEQTKHMPRAELFAALGLFFTPEQLDEAKQIITMKRLFGDDYDAVTVEATYWTTRSTKPTNSED